MASGFSKMFTQWGRSYEYWFYGNGQFSFLNDVLNRIFFIYVRVTKIDDFTIIFLLELPFLQ